MRDVLCRVAFLLLQLLLLADFAGSITIRLEIHQQTQSKRVLWVADSAEAGTRWFWISLILTLGPAFVLDQQMCFNRDWQCLTNTHKHTHTHTHTHVHRLRHALSSNTPPLAEGRLAHLWLLTPGASHLLSATISFCFQSPGLSPLFSHLAAQLYQLLCEVLIGKRDLCSEEDSEVQDSSEGRPRGKRFPKEPWTTSEW